MDPSMKAPEWQQAQSMMIQLFQNQQAQIEEFIQVRSLEDDAQQQFSEKIDWRCYCGRQKV